MHKLPLWPLEREAVLDAVELDLPTPQAVQLTSFQVAQESDIFEIGMDGARVALRSAGSAQMAMDWESSSIDADTLVGWLTSLCSPRTGRAHAEPAAPSWRRW